MELLCTNSDLLNFMFDKMFFNMRKEIPGADKEGEETDASSNERNMPHQNKPIVRSGDQSSNQ